MGVCVSGLQSCVTEPCPVGARRPQPLGMGPQQAGGQEGGEAPFLKEPLSHLFSAFG